SDVTDPRIIAAMLELARERFVSEARADMAYLDMDAAVSWLESRKGRYLLKPMVLAKMVQAGEVRETDHVLDVGCASGYSSALLAKLARSVVALEEDPVLANLAQANLSRMAGDKAIVLTGPLV
ncbi:MAG: protein-L-isoaspartate O-methyltransferase, partial [Alphaproteobacteria bacterium]